MNTKRGKQCCAFGCRKRWKKGTRSDSEGSSDEESAKKRPFPRTFHSFPSDENRMKQWVIQTHRKDWAPTKHSRICSDHFFEKDLDRTGQVVRVRENAVPMRFKQFPPSLKKERKERKPPAERTRSDDVVTLEVPEDSNEQPPKEVSLVADHDYQITQSPKTLKKQLEKSHDKIISLRKELKTAQQKSRRLKKKVTALKAVVKQLRQRHLISSDCKELLSHNVWVLH